MFSPVIITSKRARDDYNTIQGNHSSMLKSMAIQQQKREISNQQKQAELATQNTMKAEMDKEKMVSDTAAQKNANDFALRQAEIDIKRAALSD